MGADAFISIEIGRFKTVNDAFSSAFKQAAWEHGHSGYTGTIAEKSVDGLKQRHDLEAKTNPINYIETNLWDLIENDKIEKWGAVHYAEIKDKAVIKRLKEQNGLKGKRNIKIFIFFGLASC